MPDAPLRLVVYASSASGLLGPADLADILRSSRRNNASSGVTGALVYEGGNVMQALEGPPDAVAAVFERIGRDRRHGQILTLLDRPVAERAFPDWAMGLVRASQLPDDARADVRSLSDLTEPGPGLARRLLSSFRAVAPTRVR